jgi:hypothetical protein
MAPAKPPSAIWLLFWGLNLGRDGINVNAVAIGATLNDRNLVGDPDYAENWAKPRP